MAPAARIAYLMRSPLEVGPAWKRLSHHSLGGRQHSGRFGRNRSDRGYGYCLRSRALPWGAPTVVMAPARQIVRLLENRVLLATYLDVKEEFQ
jgi:hypothetical protein